VATPHSAPLTRASPGPARPGAQGQATHCNPTQEAQALLAAVLPGVSTRLWPCCPVGGRGAAVESRNLLNKLKLLKYIGKILLNY